MNIHKKSFVFTIFNIVIICVFYPFLTLIFIILFYKSFLFFLWFIFLYINLSISYRKKLTDNLHFKLCILFLYIKLNIRHYIWICVYLHFIIISDVPIILLKYVMFAFIFILYKCNMVLYLEKCCSNEFLLRILKFISLLQFQIKKIMSFSWRLNNYFCTFIVMIFFFQFYPIILKVINNFVPLL